MSDSPIEGTAFLMKWTHCTVLFITVINFVIVLYCAVLYRTLLDCNTLHCAVRYWAVLCVESCLLSYAAYDCALYSAVLFHR